MTRISLALERLVLALLLALSTAACTTDGGNGDKGVVRFSQMVDFKETEDFTAPLVQKRTVLVRLEHANALVSSQVRQDGFPELTLDVSGTSNFHVFPLGFGEFGVVFDDEGSFRLVAKQEGKAVDSIGVTVQKMSNLRFSKEAFVTTTGSGSGSCVRAGWQVLDGLVLHPNQMLTVVAVPTNADGKPMVGLLSVTAKASSSALKLDTPLFAEATTPNALEITGSGLGNAIDVTITEASGPTAKLRLDTSSSSADVSCP